MGLLATLTGVLHVAKREAIQLIKDLYGIDISVGSVPNVEERVSTALDPIYDRIHKFIMGHTFCTHFDETGWRDRGGKCHFVWLATCQQAAVYRIDRNRSTAAFRRLIKQETWTAPAVTDRYAVYGSFKNHQYCLAHLIREFKGHGERDGPDKVIGLSIESELRLSCQIHREYREGKIPLIQRNRRLGARKRRVEYWLDDGLANGSDVLAKICGVLLLRILRSYGRLLESLGWNRRITWRKETFGSLLSGGGKAMGPEATGERSLSNGSSNT